MKRSLIGLVMVLVCAGFLMASERVKNKPVYATWIMIWNSSTESWWNPADYHGTKVEVDGKWASVDWNNPEYVKQYVKNIKAAGIDVIVIDLTNGFKWISQAQEVAKWSQELGMKVCVAFNDGGKAETYESDAMKVWTNLASPDSPYASAYFHKDGKPLLVRYVTSSAFTTVEASQGEYKQKFNDVWASGESSAADKWGWQLEPFVGPVASKDSMFVTSAIKWYYKSEGSLYPAADRRWRKSLAWLDYNFLVAKKEKPDFVVVGSYDDIRERNGWLVADTTNSEKGMQMRDPSGAISTKAYYNRVREWIENKPSSIKGGVLKDGAYRIVNKQANQILGFEGNGYLEGDPAKLVEKRDNLFDYIWLYHLGDNTYRLIKLNSGLSLEVQSNDDGAAVIQNWDEDQDSQKWTLKRDEKGTFQIINKSTGEAMDVQTATTGMTPSIIQNKPSTSSSQMWDFEKIITIN